MTAKGRFARAVAAVNGWCRKNRRPTSHGRRYPKDDRLIVLAGSRMSRAESPVHRFLPASSDGPASTNSWHGIRCPRPRSSTAGPKGFGATSAIVALLPLRWKSLGHLDALAFRCPLIRVGRNSRSRASDALSAGDFGTPDHAGPSICNSGLVVWMHRTGDLTRKRHVVTAEW
jgi:hypothetical protein